MAEKSKPKIKYPVIVEGRYDKLTLSSIFSASILTTEGFSVFNSKEKQALLFKIASNGVIVLCDSDAGGRQIRNFLGNVLPKDKIFNLYIPDIFGKEKRKRAPSRSGRLGVERMEREILEKIFQPYIEGSESKPPIAEITKYDLYVNGLSGGEGSREKREKLSARFGFPHDMSANALIEAINLTEGKAGFEAALNEIFGEKAE